VITQVKRGWRADFWLGTHRVRKTMPSKKLAEVYEVTKKNEHIQGKFIPSSKKDRTTFSEFADEFYRLHCQVNMQDPEMTIQYQIKKFKLSFADKLLSEITIKDIEEWKSQYASHVKPSSVNRHIDTLKTLFAKAVEWGKLKGNVVSKIKRLRVDNRRVRYLSNDEIKRLLRAAKPRLKEFLILALNTGMRRSNSLGLRWEDIDFKNGVIHVLKTKSGKAYEVPINNVLLNLFKTIQKGEPSGLVLDSTNLRRDFNSTLRKAKIENCTIHDLRHTFASHLAMKGIDIYTISQLMGHSDIKMTQRYAHLAPNHKKIAVNMISFTDDQREARDKGVQISYSAN